jgi:hypothetical protein
MAEYVDFTLTLTDNSSGVRDEDGTEVQIYSDSPSYKPTERIDYAFARHGWMRLPLVGAGITTIPIKLKAPVTFVTVRCRQFNANGNGDWATPGGGAGTRFEFNPAQNLNAPNAPSTIGLIVAGTATPPVDPPVDPPPIPEPGGTVTTYTYTSQFSGVQGQSNWSYRDEDGNNLTYDAARQVWDGAESYQSLWVNGIHPGTTKGTVLRFTAPEDCTLGIAGDAGLYASSGSNGVTLTIKHDSTTIYGPTDLLAGAAAIQMSESETMLSGEYIDFIVKPISGNANCSTGLAPIVTISTGGAAIDPVLANISPSSLSMETGSVSSFRVNLSSNAVANSTVTLASDATSIATVPASVIIPIGQSFALFDITAVADGAATITATYNSTSVDTDITCSTPVAGTQWPNEPTGMTLVTNTPFSDTLPSEWANFYNTQAYASPNLGGQMFSSPRCFDVFKAAGTMHGNGQWGLFLPSSSELYIGFYWGTNAGFQGWSNNGNKMLFVRNPTIDNNYFGWMGPQDGPKVLKWNQQANYNNTHLSGVVGTNWPTDGSGRFENNVNEAAATYTAGQPMRFVEIYLKKSATTTSRDGIIKWWVNGTLCASYTGVNLTPPGFTEFHINSTWDGSVDPTVDMNRSWHHYYDHFKVSRR